MSALRLITDVGQHIKGSIWLLVYVRAKPYGNSLKQSVAERSLMHRPIPSHHANYRPAERVVVGSRGA